MENYLLIQELSSNEAGGLVEVVVNGNSPILVDVIATAMQQDINLAMLIAYANDEYKKRLNGKARPKKVKAAKQLSIF